MSLLSNNVYNDTKDYFSKYENVKLIKGILPDTFKKIRVDKISYLSLDLNVPNVELKILEILWKKIVSGGIVLLDDFTHSFKYVKTYEIFSSFAQKNDFEILELPTGQGIIFKR